MGVNSVGSAWEDFPTSHALGRGEWEGREGGDYMLLGDVQQVIPYTPPSIVLWEYWGKFIVQWLAGVLWDCWHLSCCAPSSSCSNIQGQEWPCGMRVAADRAPGTKKWCELIKKPVEHLYRPCVMSAFENPQLPSASWPQVLKVSSIPTTRGSESDCAFVNPILRLATGCSCPADHLHALWGPPATYPARVASRDASLGRSVLQLGQLLVSFWIIHSNASFH